MMLKDLKKIIIEYGKIIDKKTFSPGASGNLSLRYGDKILITASGASNGKLDDKSLSIIDFAGNVLKGNRNQKISLGRNSAE